jgi:hypothetical protein
MKRVVQLFLIILALTAVNLAAGPHKGGSRVENKAGEYGYYCYSDGIPVDCGNLSSCYCRAECDRECGGRCDWDGSCIIA